MITFPPPAFAAADLPELLQPVLEEYREAARRNRRLPDELIDRLRALGAFRLSTPRELGGHELPLTASLDVLRRLARLDPTVTWNICILNAGFTAGFLEDAAVGQIWSAGPDPLIASSGAPGRLQICDEGYLLSGEWKMVTAVDAADWLALISVLDPPTTEPADVAARETRACFVPRDAVTVQETWHTFGLRGTNSNTVILNGLPVPAEMTLPFPAEPRIDRALYRIPFLHIAYSTIAALALGIAQSAVDELIEPASAEKGADGQPLTHEPRFQALIGRSTARLGAATGYLLETAGELDRIAEARESPGEAERGALRGAACLAGETARDVLVAAFEAGSSSPIYQSSRLGQIFLDGMVAVQHVNVATADYELAGRTALGLPANTDFV